MRNARKAQGWLQEAKRISSQQPMKNMMYLWTSLKMDVANIQADLLKLPHGDGNE